MRYTAQWYDLDTRFDTITDYLGDKTPRHVLDFGALDTVMATRFTTRYGSHVLAVDDTLTGPAPDGVEFITKKLGPSQIRKLPRQDVTLCLSVLHHQAQWKNYLDALTSISDILFVESAHPDETLPLARAHHKSPAILGELKKRGTALCETEGYDPRFTRTLWVIST